jgi:hypothetical protein
MIIVSYPLRLRGNDMEKLDTQIASAVGAEVAGSGIGFGMRDLEFEDPSLTKRIVEGRLRNAGITTAIVHDIG